MKKIFAISAVALIAASTLMTGCNKDKEQVFQLNPPEFNGLEKTTLNGNQTYWANGDVLDINGVRGTVSTAAQTSTVTLNGTVTAVNNLFYSFYGGRATNVQYNGNNGYSYTMPSSYTYYAGELKVPMAGSCLDNERTIQFSNICTVLKLDFVVIPNQVVITSESTALTGDFTATYDGSSWTVTPPAATSSNKTITINNPNYASTIYVPLPAGTHKLTITGKTFTIPMKSAQNMQKGYIYPLTCAHKFTVNTTHNATNTGYVYFSPGNFQYYNTSNYSLTNQGRNANQDASYHTYARFANNQWDRVQGANISSNGRPATGGTWIDLFGWGTGFIPGYNYFAHNGGSGVIAYDDFNDWGSYYSIHVNSTSHCTGSWFTMSDDQWRVLLNITNNSARNGLSCMGTVNGVRGLIIAPDNYNTLRNLTGAASLSMGMTITITDWTNKYQKLGVVFLPGDCGYASYWTGYVDSFQYESGMTGYWTSHENGAGDRYADFLKFPQNTSSMPTISNERLSRSTVGTLAGNKIARLSVRLVQSAPYNN